MLLKDEDIGKFLAKLDALPDREKIVLKRAIGQDFEKQTYGTKLAIVFAFPEAFLTERVIENKTMMQNLFFTACAKFQHLDQDRSATAKPEKIVKGALYRRFNNEDAVRNYFAEILSMHTGPGSRLYRELGEAIAGSDGYIDCYLLLKDLNYWDNTNEQYKDKVQMRWALAFARPDNETATDKED